MKPEHNQHLWVCLGYPVMNQLDYTQKISAKDKYKISMNLLFSYRFLVWINVNSLKPCKE